MESVLSRILGRLCIVRCGCLQMLFEEYYDRIFVPFQFKRQDKTFHDSSQNQETLIVLHQFKFHFFFFLPHRFEFSPTFENQPWRLCSFYPLWRLLQPWAFRWNTWGLLFSYLSLGNSLSYWSSPTMKCLLRKWGKVGFWDSVCVWDSVILDKISRFEISYKDLESRGFADTEVEWNCIKW